MKDIMNRTAKYRLEKRNMLNKTLDIFVQFLYLKYPELVRNMTNLSLIYSILRCSIFSVNCYNINQCNLFD